MTKPEGKFLYTETIQLYCKYSGLSLSALQMYISSTRVRTCFLAAFFILLHLDFSIYSCNRSFEQFLNLPFSFSNQVQVLFNIYRTCLGSVKSNFVTCVRASIVPVFCCLNLHSGCGKIIPVFCCVLAHTERGNSIVFVCCLTVLS